MRYGGVGVGVRRGAATTTNKGFARRPQEFLGWEVCRYGGMRYEVWTWACINKASRALVTKGA